MSAPLNSWDIPDEIHEVVTALLEENALLKIETQSAIGLISAERKRQIEKLGYDLDHDARFPGQLALAGSGYAITAAAQIEHPAMTLPSCFIPKCWPWRREAFRPGTTIENLVKAGALIASEIDRELKGGANSKPS